MAQNRFSYVTQWIYGLALMTALLTAGVIVAIVISVNAASSMPLVVPPTTTTTTLAPVTLPPFTCNDSNSCPLNCSAVEGCLPPPAAIVCNDVVGCLTGGNLTLNQLTVQQLVVQNISQVDISYQSVFSTQDIFVNGTFTCGLDVTVDDNCIPLRIATINVIPPNSMTKNFVIGGGPGIGIAGHPNGLDIFNTGVLHVNLSAPVGEFLVTSGTISSDGTLTFVKIAQSGNSFWGSPVNGSSGVPVFRQIAEVDLPFLSLFDKVYGTLAAALGGTGSNVTLVGGRIMISQSAGQQIVEGPNLPTLGQFLIGDGTGGMIPATLVGGYDANVTAYPNGTIAITVSMSVHSVDLAVPTDIFSVTSSVITNTGTLTFVAIPQPGNQVWASPQNGSTGVPSFRPLAEADVPQLSLLDKVYGVLPVANGGTNNSGPLIGNRLMMSTSGSIVEAPALANGEIFIGQNGGLAPVPATPTGGGGITIGTGPGTLSVTMTSTPSFSTLNVAGATTLGTTTTCAAALDGSCVEISNKVCPLGPVGVNCIPTSGLHFTELTVDVLNILNFTTQTSVTIVNGTNLSMDNLYAENIYLVGNGSLSCSGSSSVAQNCIDISGMSCPLGALQQSCVPTNLTTSNIQSTGTATFNNVVCAGAALPDNCVSIDSKTCTLPVGDTCVSLHVKTVNGVAPNSLTRDLLVTGGTGISVSGTVVTNTVASTPQTQNLFYASPDGTTGLPGFRPLSATDLPTLGAENVNFGNSGPTNLTTLVQQRAVSSVDVTVPSSLLAVSGSPILPGPAGGVIALTLQPQATGGVFASPINAPGTPSFRNLTYSDIPPVITSVDLVVPSDVLSIAGSPLLAGYGGTLTVTKVNQTGNTFWASPKDGTSGEPVFRKQVFKDFNNLNLTDGQLLGGTTGGDAVPTDILAGSGIVLTKNAGSVTISASINASNIGTVTNVCITAPGTLFTFSPACINTSGTFTFVPLVQQANKFFGAPDGSNGYPGMRYIALADLPRLYAGQMYIGDPTSDLTSISNLTAGNAVSIVTSGGLTTISTTFSVGMTVPTSIMSVTGSPITNMGTFAVTLLTQLARTFFAGPASGSAAAPGFRVIALSDLPALGDGQMYIGNGGVPVASTISAGAGLTVTPGMGSLTISANNFGTVTSVSLALPVSVFSVSGAVTSSGTLMGTFISQTANTFFAAPDGSAGTPSFRAMVAADVPSLDTSKLTAGILPIARGGTNSGTALNNNRIMVSSGGAIVEAAALTAGQFLVGGISGVPTAGTIVGTTNQVNVAQSLGTFTLSTPQNIHTAATPTFASENLTATTNQLRLGTTNTVTISATAPAASRTMTIDDAGANAHFVTDTASALTITNSPTSGYVLTGGGGTTASFQAPAAATSLTYNEVSSTTSIPGFNSGPVSFTVVTGMTMTLAAGTWHVTFNSIIAPTTSSLTFEVALFNGGTVVPHSSRSVSGSSAVYTVHTQAVMVSDGSTAIAAQWRLFSGSGSGTMFSRSMFAMRVA